MSIIYISKLIITQYILKKFYKIEKLLLKLKIWYTKMLSTSNASFNYIDQGLKEKKNSQVSFFASVTVNIILI